MKLDLDDFLKYTHPWDLVIEVGGNIYPTIRPSVVQVQALLTACTTADDREIRSLLPSLFVEPTPPVGTWTAAQLLHFVSGYLHYFNMRVGEQKKRETVPGGAGGAVAALAVEALDRQAGHTTATGKSRHSSEPASPVTGAMH